MYNGIIQNLYAVLVNYLQINSKKDYNLFCNHSVLTSDNLVISQNIHPLRGLINWLETRLSFVCNCIDTNTDN